MDYFTSHFELLEKKQENDVVIINKRIKTVYVIESKTNLNAKTGADAVEQIKTLKIILEDFSTLITASQTYLHIFN